MLSWFGNVVVIYNYIPVGQQFTVHTAGVKLYGGPKASSLLKIPETREFHHEYNSLACTVEIVDDVHAAIEHIHKHGRHATFYLLITANHS